MRRRKRWKRRWRKRRERRSNVPTLCALCGLSYARSRCRICGRPVCDDCMGESGVCKACAETLCELCRRNLAIGRCAVCGRLVCEECSVQLNPVIRVCRECYSKGLRPVYKPPARLALLVERMGLR